MDIFHFISVVCCHTQQKTNIIESSGAIMGGNGTMPPEIFFVFRGLYRHMTPELSALRK